MKIEHNEGMIDRIVRMVLGTVIIGAGIWFNSLWGLIGLLPLVTGIIGYCGVYKVFGWSTVEKAVKKVSKRRVVKRKSKSKKRK